VNIEEKHLLPKLKEVIRKEPEYSLIYPVNNWTYGPSYFTF
jgi:hypothetical protein